ncbi:hypothetical protein PR048_025595 [Dryococelus australis]|uniref:Uncharacterized protein n=1 Tax=Dryococelus australis TaxID=614101 RepID=A0ABQ9GRR1_9NEOP|nr:hypothetical protein PR048_025595 [Dryococelus australis]
MSLYPDEECESFNLLKTSWQYQARQFFQNSTLHGVRYLRQEGRPFYERSKSEEIRLNFRYSITTWRVWWKTTYELSEWAIGNSIWNVSSI